MLSLALVLNVSAESVVDCDCCCCWLYKTWSLLFFFTIPCNWFCLPALHSASKVKCNFAQSSATTVNCPLLLPPLLAGLFAIVRFGIFILPCYCYCIANIILELSSLSWSELNFDRPFAWFFSGFLWQLSFLSPAIASAEQVLNRKKSSRSVCVVNRWLFGASSSSSSSLSPSVGSNDRDTLMICIRMTWFTSLLFLS